MKPNVHTKYGPPDERNKAEKFWDRTAIFYDKEEKKDDLTYLKFIEKAKKYLKVNDIVLDFGCGTGLVCNEIADNVKMIYAIDISSEMIDIAKNKAFGSKIRNINFVYTTIFDERFKRDTLDVIIVLNVLHLLEDSQKVIQRIYELLKPEGLIISATPCMGERPVLNSLFSIGSKIGITPKIKSFKISEFEQFFIKENFEIIETDCLKQNSPQYLLIAKKLKSV
jgi:2-polyprenyl-3-methyl-5-hydroxy-6-metoxy-1,4-benzoquinol methylase